MAGTEEAVLHSGAAEPLPEQLTAFTAMRGYNPRSVRRSTVEAGEGGRRGTPARHAAPLLSLCAHRTSTTGAHADDASSAGLRVVLLPMSPQHGGGDAQQQAIVVPGSDEPIVVHSIPTRRPS